MQFQKISILPSREGLECPWREGRVVYVRPNLLRNAGRFIGQNFQRDGEGSDLRKIIPFHWRGVRLYPVHFCKILFFFFCVLLKLIDGNTVICEKWLPVQAVSNLHALGHIRPPFNG